MLFDLRGRGRRRTIQGIYLGLAILMGGGLVLFGVGTGVGGGGLLNALTGSGSGGAQKQVITGAEKQALAATRQRPNDPSAWSQLIQARWTSAGQGGNYDPATLGYTASGKNELSQLTQDWQRYLKLTKKPDPSLAILAARAYAQLGEYGGAADAWEVQTVADPTAAKGYECLAANAYAAKQTRKGDLAAAKAISLVPKGTGLSIKQALQQAKTNPQVAQRC
jgi:hypothetical protein